MQKAHIPQKHPECKQRIGDAHDADERLRT